MTQADIISLALAEIESIESRLKSLKDLILTNQSKPEPKKSYKFGKRTVKANGDPTK